MLEVGWGWVISLSGFWASDHSRVTLILFGLTIEKMKITTLKIILKMNTTSKVKLPQT